MSRQVGEYANASLIADALDHLKKSDSSQVEEVEEEVPVRAVVAQDDSWLSTSNLLMYALMGATAVASFAATQYLMSWLFSSSKSVVAASAASAPAAIAMPAEGIEFAKWAANHNEVTSLAQEVLQSIPK